MPALIRTRSRERGQALVLMVGGMVAVIAMVALIVDGGNAWSQQRIVQNGSDAAAEAGAIVMAQRFAGASTPALGWDATVQSAISSTSASRISCATPFRSRRSLCCCRMTLRGLQT